MYWKEIAIFSFGLFSGGMAGVYLTLSLLKTELGDEYQIIKPKVKGENNALDVAQYNTINEKNIPQSKSGFIKRILKRKKND